MPLTAYDEVAYPGAAYAQTHPDRLATVATLFGLKPASPGRCRVLELGCGDGGNLVPMAYTLKGSEFLGIDLAPSAVARGRETIAALGLSNVTLTAADLRSVSDLGTFDYVIAHGLYSWVPSPVQQRILELAREVLAPHGVAYVSYNAYPGNYTRDAVRKMQEFHVRGIEEPAKKIEQARALVRLLAEAAEPDPVFSAILQETRKYHDSAPDAAIFHDEIAEVNEPLFFMEFIERAATHGLQFLSEADYSDNAPRDEDTPAARLSATLGCEDVLLQQQYRDFLAFRRFRQTLLCRENVVPKRPVDPDRLRGLAIAAPMRPENPEPPIASDAPLRFLGPDNSEITTSHPLGKAAFLTLWEAWPGWLPWPELLAVSVERLAVAGGPSVRAEDEERLLAFLLRTYAASILELHATRCPFVAAPSDRPRASALARREAVVGTVVTSLKHKCIRLADDLVRHLVSLLDGTRDRAALLDEMARFVRESGRPDADQLLGVLPEGLEKNLHRVATLALLEA